MEILITIVNRLYGISIHSSERVVGGFLSENYVLSGETKRFFLKKYRFDDPQRITEVHEAKSLFSGGGVPVIVPLTSLDGKTFFEHNASLYALFPFVEGIHKDESNMTFVEITSFGSMLGKIHRVGSNTSLRVSDRFNFKMPNTKNILKTIDDILMHLQNSGCTTNFDHLAQENLLLKKNLIEAHKDYFTSTDFRSDHLVHGDYLTPNVFFDESEQIAHVFDFEKIGYYPRLQEFFRSLSFTFLSQDMEQSCFNKARVYTNAYVSTYPTTSDDLRRGWKLFFLKAIQGIWVMEEHYLKNNTRVDELLIQDVKRIKNMVDNQEDIIDFLSS